MFDWWKDEVLCVPTMEYYLAVKQHAKSWMYLENIMLSEKKPVTTDHILYDFIYVQLPEEVYL